MPRKSLQHPLNSIHSSFWPLNKLSGAQTCHPVHHIHAGTVDLHNYYMELAIGVTHNLYFYYRRTIPLFLRVYCECGHGGPATMLQSMRTCAVQLSCSSLALVSDAVGILRVRTRVELVGTSVRIVPTRPRRHAQYVLITTRSDPRPPPRRTYWSWSSGQRRPGPLRCRQPVHQSQAGS